tara:strand:- start:151 stop:393 length:243 start_codon:yes stop_codon:yes gene_type:complete
MKKYKYKTAFIRVISDELYAEYDEVRDSVTIGEISSNNLEEALVEYGEEGWDLVYAKPTTESRNRDSRAFFFICIFKKEI